MAMLCFNSGTMGLPKAAMLSHYNFVAQHTAAFEATPRPYAIKRLVFLPTFHVSTAPMCYVSALRAGTPHVVLRRLDVDEVLSHIPAHDITDLVVVPPMVVSFVSHRMPASQKRKCLKALE
jgi:4-coumarate--CoA ligase